MLDLLPLVKRQESKEVWVREDGSSVREHWVGSAVSLTCKNICGLNVTPLSLRRLRTTFSIEAIDELDGRLIDKEGMKVELALASGHTREDQEKYYIIKSNERLLKRSKLVTDFTNDLLFGTMEGETQDMSMAEDDPDQGLQITEPIWSKPGARPKPKNVRKNKTNAMNVESSDESECDYLVSDESESTAISSADGFDSDRFESCDSKAQEIYDAWRPWQATDSSIGSLQNGAMVMPMKRRPALKVAMKAETISRVRGGHWLIDADILWALEMLRRRFPVIGGLEDTCVLAHGTSKCMATEPMNVYVVHTGGNHWATVAVHGKDGEVESQSRSI